MRHPQLSDLALFAGGDLGFFASLETRLHVARCTECRAEVERFSDASKTLKAEAAQLPEGLDFDNLAAEMRANIKLGLEAGSIASHVIANHMMDAPRHEEESFGWRGAFVLAAGTLVIITGWFLHVSAPEQTRLAAVTPPVQGISIEATQAGVEVKENGGAFALRSPESQPVTLTVSSEGSVNARYVDSETGQVTINNVSF